ncbi:sterol desaturase family protein [Congregibacter sp.]|uniref:sterol desaturase family protein n=1 Tax=Congregibacter sp. TaxID=2744308 RepID=UPI003F6AF9B1
MFLDLDSGKLYVFLGGLILFGLIELWIPSRRRPPQRLQRYCFHAAVAALNTVVIRILVFVPFLLWAVHVDEQGWGVARWLGLHGWFEILASIVALDAFDYAWHRANHRIRFLWRFHKAHHADTGMDVSTALRFHPGELLLSGLVKAGWIAVWGPTAVAWFLFELLVSLCAQFHHANIALPSKLDSVLGRVLVTPRYHGLHHLTERRFGDRNFATIFPWWDALFGTAVKSVPGDDAKFGLPEDRGLALAPLEWILEPFRSRNLDLASSTSRQQSGESGV